MSDENEIATSCQHKQPPKNTKEKTEDKQNLVTITTSKDEGTGGAFHEITN